MTSVLINCVRYGLLRCERPKPWIAHVKGPRRCHIGTCGTKAGMGMVFGDAEPAGGMAGVGGVLWEAVLERARLAVAAEDL